MGSPSPSEVDTASHDDLSHFAELVRSVPAAIISANREGRMLSWNGGAEQLFGFSAEEALGVHQALIVPEDRRAEAVRFETRAQAGETMTIHTVRRHKTGRLLDVALSLAPVRDVQDGIVGTCTVMQAVPGRWSDARQSHVPTAGAQRQSAEEALAASTRDFRTFFEMANVGNVIADPQSGRFLRVNRHFCEMTGYTVEELSNMNADDLTDPADVERDRIGWAAAVRSEAPSCTIEKRYRRKDGSLFWVHVTSTLVRDVLGEPIHAFGVIRDVTDRRQAMEDLQLVRVELESRVANRTAELSAAITAARQSALRLEALIENSPLAIISLDLEMRVQTWNPAAERLFGWMAAEVLGQPLPILPAENRGQYEAEVREIMASPQRLHWETQRQRRDGSVLEVEMWRVPLRTSDNALHGVTAIMMDVTERKFLERALLDAAERESRRIGQELHDHLCQHLLGAAFSAKAVAMGLPAEVSTSAELHRLAGLINSAVQQARDIARGLNPVEMDAAGLMAALQALTERSYAGITCRLKCEQSVLLLDATAALHAYRIAQEAVANAVEHSGCTEIVVRLSEDARNIVLRIEDNGRGFESRAGVHRGLGLEIMKYRAHAISGKISIDTAPDRGTSVVLLLSK